MATSIKRKIKEDLHSIKLEKAEDLILINSEITDQKSSNGTFTSFRKNCAVIVDNLSNDTSENYIFRMAKKFGKIKYTHMERQFYRAEIGFDDSISANKFLQAYQRAMVDLSILKIRLKDQEVN